MIAPQDLWVVRTRLAERWSKTPGLRGLLIRATEGGGVGDRLRLLPPGVRHLEKGAPQRPYQDLAPAQDLDLDGDEDDRTVEVDQQRVGDDVGGRQDRKPHERLDVRLDERGGVGPNEKGRAIVLRDVPLDLPDEGTQRRAAPRRPFLGVAQLRLLVPGEVRVRRLRQANVRPQAERGPELKGGQCSPHWLVPEEPGQQGLRLPADGGMERGDVHGPGPVDVADVPRGPQSEGREPVQEHHRIRVLGDRRHEGPLRDTQG